jgi:chromosome segregation ATPase
LDDLRSQVDHAQKGKLAAEKLSKQLEQQLNDIHIKLDEHLRQITDLNQQKSRLSNENSDLVRQLEEFEHQVAILSKTKATTQQQLEESKRIIEDTLRGKGSVSKFKSSLKDPIFH